MIPCCGTCLCCGMGWSLDWLESAYHLHLHLASAFTGMKGFSLRLRLRCSLRLVTGASSLGTLLACLFKALAVSIPHFSSHHYSFSSKHIAWSQVILLVFSFNCLITTSSTHRSVSPTHESSTLRSHPINHLLGANYRSSVSVVHSIVCVAPQVESALRRSAEFNFARRISLEVRSWRLSGLVTVVKVFTVLFGVGVQLVDS